MEIGQIIDESINEYYSSRGMNVPKWKQKRVDWWTNYLTSLGMDPRNI